MTYLIGQIILCLVLASVLGLIAGWLLRGTRCRADMRLLKKELQTRREKIERSEQRIAALKRSVKELEHAREEDQQLAQERIQQLEPYQAETVWLRQEINNTTSQTNKQITDLNEQLESMQSLTHDVKVNETVIQRLESQLRTQGQAKERQVTDLTARLAEMEPLAAQLEAKDRALQKAAVEHKQQVGELTQQLQQLRTASESRRQSAIQVMGGQGPSGQDSPGAQDTVDSHPADHVGSQPTRALGATVANPDTPDGESPAPHASVKPQPAPQDKDDLKTIHGIGPVMERMLNDLGVTSFKQIMEFTRDDMERVTAAIAVFPGRIERDDWIGGARKAYQKKYANKIQTEEH